MAKKRLLSEAYRKRFEEELSEIDVQEEHEYFLDLYKKKARFPENENNLLVAYLLDLVEGYDQAEPPAYVQGEFPDIDIDYLPVVRDYLKNEWAPKEFGADRVCNIGNYTTFGIKSSLLDMNKVHGYKRDEILALTTKIGLKDDEGATLTWDKALEIFPELKDFCDAHPDVSGTAKRLLTRNRCIGQHAGGLIIANGPIADVVPLMRGKEHDGTFTTASAWTEGLHSQDLAPVGYVKFDLLVVTDLLRVVHCNQLIKQRHPEIQKICALPEQSDWSDTSYLNDPKALALANSGKLKGVFQFDSFGIRKLCREGGVSSFEDLVAYASLYRPGPLNMKMHDVYVQNKKDLTRQWVLGIPDLIKPILLKTYNVMCYQEQVMQILNKVGNIPLIHCEKIRKAISKKKIEIFGKYREMFIENGQKTIGYTKEQMINLWDQIASFAEYGFNRSHAVAYTFISSRLLWQKAHFPIEFYTTLLRCEDKDKKIKEYKLDTTRAGINVEKLSLEHSGVNFDIVGDAIHIGFSNVKGIGPEVAAKIVAGKPYAGIEDFLDRAGVGAGIVKPLVALGVFGPERRKMFEYYEFYKKETKKYKDRNKRFEASHLANVVAMQNIWVENTPGVEPPPESFFFDMIAEMSEVPDKKVLKDYLEPKYGHTLVDLSEFLSCFKKYRKRILDHDKKELAFKEGSLKYETFVPKNEIEDLPMDDLLNLSMVDAEMRYYGFGWDHPIEDSPDYDGGKTLYQFEADEELGMAPVELHIVKKPVEKLAKNGKTTYYRVTVEDADFTRTDITFWEDDYKRFEEELNYWENDLVKGHYIRASVVRPQGNFNPTFYGPPKRQRWKLAKDKAEDGRLMILRRKANDDRRNNVE